MINEDLSGVVWKYSKGKRKYSLFKSAALHKSFPNPIEGDLIDLGAACEVIQKSGAWYNYGDMRIGQGREKAKQYLVENKDLCKEVKEKILIAKGLGN